MFKATVAAAFLLVVGYLTYLASDTLTWFVAEAAALALLSVRVCGGTLVGLAAVGALWLLLRQQYERDRQRDGAWAVEYHYLVSFPRRVLLWLMGRPIPKVRIDPNAYLGHALVIADAVYEVAPAAGWDRQLAYMTDQERTNRTRAAIPGDGVLGLPWWAGAGKNGVANAATGRMLAGAYDRPIKPPVTIDQPPAVPALPAPVNVALEDALDRTEAQAWPLGYNADGGIAWFNPLSQGHAAIVGATGTGKTMSVGYLMAAHALRQGWHVVILDADDGSAWTPFTMQAEHHATAPDVFAGQIAALRIEFERRMQLISEAGTPDVSGLRGARRVLVVIEEYGDLSHTLRKINAAQAKDADDTLDTLLRRGRKAGIHVVLLDQYPEYWSNQLIANTKFRVVFQLGPNQGAKMEEYAAAKLPDRGEFLLRGQRYTAWHAAPVVRRLLSEVPALSAEARIVGGRSDVPWHGQGGQLPEVERQNGARNVPQERNVGTPADDAPGRWDDVVAAWFAANPQALTGPALGISDLARAMCRDNEGGSEANYGAYKGRAHPLFHEFRNSARLPNGARLGTDITGGA